MRVDFYGLVFETPKVTVYLWSPWRASALEHRLFEAVHGLPGLRTVQEADEMHVEITDANGAFFDAAHGFAGCIAGIQEMLRRQRLLASARCLDSREMLSVGQAAEIDRVCRAYPHLADDEFVAANIEKWMRC